MRSLELHRVMTGTPREMPRGVKYGAIALLVVGVLATSAGLATATERTSAAFVVNFIYWAGIAQGGFMFAVALVITKCRWGRPLKRIAEAMGLFMIPLYVLLIAFLLAGGLEIYPWFHWGPGEAPAHKAIYLRPAFFVARQVVGLGILIALNLVFVRASLRADLGLALNRLGVEGPAWWKDVVDDWRGDDVEEQDSTEVQARLSPALAIVYAFVFSVVAVDLSMSLAPHWFANMFPAWYFAACFWSGLVFLGIISLLARKWLGIEHLLTGSVYHDLGKLTFGFTMFWAYTLFAQYLAIWYGNMDEEIGFILLRTRIEPWAGLSKVVLALCFFVPFAMLLSRGLKKIPPAYLSVAGVIAVGLWLERFVQVMPSVWKESTLPLGYVEIGMTLGFLGGFVLVVVGFLSKVPPVPIADPFMLPDPDEVHVHPRARGAHATPPAPLRGAPAK